MRCIQQLKDMTVPRNELCSDNLSNGETFVLANKTNSIKPQCPVQRQTPTGKFFRRNKTSCHGDCNNRFSTEFTESLFLGVFRTKKCTTWLLLCDACFFVIFFFCRCDKRNSTSFWARWVHSARCFVLLD